MKAPTEKKKRETARAECRRALHRTIASLEAVLAPHLVVEAAEAIIGAIPVSDLPAGIFEGWSNAEIEAGLAGFCETVPSRYLDRVVSRARTQIANIIEIEQWMVDDRVRDLANGTERAMEAAEHAKLKRGKKAA